MKQKVRVYIACSLDGFIAGPDDDLSWLPPAGGGEAAGSEDPGGLSYDGFMAGIGALLMGRGTFDVVQTFGIGWPYGDLPVLVSTHRPLPPVPDSVRAVEGDITTLVGLAKEAAGGKDVYLDGGQLIRQALDAKLVHELVMTIVPVVLGSGHPLFAGVEQRHAFRILGHHDYAGGLVQLHLRAHDATA